MQLNEAIGALAEGPSANALFTLARDRSADGRRALFETVLDMLREEAPALSDRERTLMGEILRQLVHEVEMALREKLAAQLARRDDVPRDLIIQLANDEIEIAYPILLESGVLEDEDLIEVVKHRTMEHQLAVSKRETMSEQVSAALVETGSEIVISSLLDNHGANISPQLIEYLVDQSKRVDRYHYPLLHRPDLSVDLAKSMYWWVSAALRKHITDTFSMDADVLDNEIESATMQSFKELEQDPAPPPKSKQLVERVSELEGLNEDFLVKTLCSGEIPLFEATLCKMAELKPERVRRMIFEPGGQALAILCRAIGIELETYMTFFELTRRAKDGQEAPTVEEKDELARFYRETRREDAERMLSRWRRSERYTKALDRLSTDP